MEKITQEELFRQYPVSARYVPTPAIIERLREIDRKTEILMFLGTWCPDSVNAAPKFIKVFDSVKNPNLSLRLYGVDRAKQDGLGLTEMFHVQRVPTIIFLRNGRELGKIVEYPTKTLEEDTLAILTEYPREGLVMRLFSQILS